MPPPTNLFSYLNNMNAETLSMGEGSTAYTRNAERLSILDNCVESLLIFSESGETSTLERLPSLLCNAELSFSSRKGESRLVPDIFRDKLAEALIQCGASFLGRGDDAVAVALPRGKYAIRIGIHSEAFDAFVALAQKINNPHFPQILYHWETAHFSITVMECLRSSVQMQHCFWQAVNDAVAYAHAIADQRPFYPCGASSMPTTLREASGILGKEALALHYALDFGRDNILVRDSGERVTPVFIDTFSPWGQ